MTAGGNLSWPGVMSVLLMLALAIFLFERRGPDAAPRPPSDRELPKTVSAKSVGPPAPISLPPPPSLASKVPTKQAVATPLEPVFTPEPRAGRALLRQLEAGEGPTIEIAWPPSDRGREKLYAVFIHCYGMVSAILDSQGRLFRAADPPGRNWALNRDRYSGFVRQVSGRRAVAEKQALARIHTHHRSRAGRSVRLFPRAVDAMLLGGLHRLIDTSYAVGAVIHARHALSGGTARVTGITINGRPVPGSVLLRPNCLR